MKKEYKKPTSLFIDYTYDEQVVAASEKFDGYGDGNRIDYCTYQSGSFSNPCTSIVNSNFDTSVCGVQPWSLRK